MGLANFIRSGVLLTSGILFESYGFAIHDFHHRVEEDKRGFYLTRFFEGLAAMDPSKNRPANHLENVLHLSSKSHADRSEKAHASSEQEEMHSLTYLANKVQSEVQGLVFSKKEQNFYFEGSLSDLRSNEAREKILKGRYSVCKMEGLIEENTPQILLLDQSSCGEFFETYFLHLQNADSSYEA